MNKRSVSYMLTHDIDWYFKSGNKLYHCASNGGLLPESCREIRMINYLKASVRSLPQIYNFERIRVNERYISTIVEQQVEIWQSLVHNSEATEININRSLIHDLYISSFMDMACRGFISLDRVRPSDCSVKITDDGYYEEYMVIASPSENLQSNDIARYLPDLTSKIEINEEKSIIRVWIN